MFWNIYQTIVNKISEYNPIRNFIKYALDKTLNQFLSRQLTLQDFKNGPLNLSNLQLNVSKINKTKLVGSPYVLHYGTIGQLNIVLPPLSEISTKSIEINVSNIQLSLKPNKQFAENFKNTMKEMFEMKAFQVQQEELQGEMSQNSTADFFKQLMKSIIMNIKLKVNGIIVKLYMNTPSENNKGSQYYTMLRIPSIIASRQDDLPLKKSTDQEQYKFKLQMPQISLHLLRQDTKYPQYENYRSQYKKQDFPFTYPPVSHPSTIFLVGAQTLGAQNQKKNTFFSLILVTDYGKKKRDLSMKLQIPNIEAMVDPLQGKILSRFLVQVLQFKKIFSQVIQQLGMKSQTSSEIDKSQMQLRRTLSRSTSQDIFSSMIMSVNDFQGFQQGGSRKRKVREPSLLDSIIQCQQMRKDVEQFNQDFKKQLAKKGKNSKQIEQFTAIDFKINIVTKVQLTYVTVYMLKYVPQTHFLRFWLSGFKEPSKINNKIGSSHFMLTLNKSQLEVQEGGKIIKFSMRKVKGYNVKLVDSAIHRQQQVQAFFDIRSSSEFYGQKQDVDMFKMELKQFNLDDGHYCVQQILRVSQKPSNNIDQDNLKLYNFLPRSDKQVSSLQHVFVQPGIQVMIDKKTSHLIKINVIDINASLTLEVLRDLLNIAYPIFSYRIISNTIGIRKQSMQGQQQPRMHKRRNLFESQYDFYRDSYIEDQQENKKQKTIILSINQIKLAYRESTNQEQFTQMIKKSKEKTFDCQNFNHVCFCNLQNRGIYAEIFSVQFHKKNEFKLSCKAVEVGLMLIKQSRINGLKSVVKVELQNPDNALKLFMQQSKDRQKIFSLYVPTLRLKLDENLIRSLMNFTMSQVKNAMALQNFRSFLQFEIKTIQGQFAEIQKKNKKQETSGDKIIQVLIGKIKIDVPFLNAEICKFFFTNLDEENKIKMHSLILALKSSKNYRLGSLTNRQLKLNQYQDKPVTENIRPCQVIMQFGYPMEKQVKTTFESKNKRQFYRVLRQENSNFILTIKRKQMSKNLKIVSVNANNNGNSKISNKAGYKDISFSDRFSFNAKEKAVKKCQSIQEQRQSKHIKLNVYVPVNINAANLIEATRLKSQIEKYQSLFKDSESTIKLVQTRSIIMERRQSEQDNQQIQLSLSFNRINVDIRPYYLSDEKQVIFSNTRSILSLYNTFKIQVKMNKEIEQKLISCEFPWIRYYFLSHQDRQTDLNPILIEDKDYLKYGFKYLAQVESLAVQVKITDKMHNENLVQIEGKLKQIKLCFSVQTFQFFKLHIQHFVKHNVQQDYSWNDDSEQFIALKIEDAQKEFQSLQYYQQIAEDLTNTLQAYEQKMIKKKHDQSQFKNRNFSKKEMPHTKLDIKRFLIGVATIQMNTGSDYLFSNPPRTMDQSSQKKRILCEPEQVKQYLQIKIKNFQLILQVTNEEPQPGLYILISVGLCDINYNTRKPTQGFIKRLVGGKGQTQPNTFNIFRNESEMKIILNKNYDRIEVKCTSAILSLGFCSDILNIVNLMKKFEKQSIKTGRKKYYHKKQQEVKQLKPKNLQKRVLFLFPSTRIILTLEYKNIELINCQAVKADELFLNQQLRNKDLIQSKITKWVKNLVLSNVGGLISGSMIKILGTLIDQIIQFVKFIVDTLLGR